MNHRSLFCDLKYRGCVRSVRRDYHVLEGLSHYILLSPSHGGGNYAVVPRAALNYIVKQLGGTKSIATSEARKACKRSKFLKDHFSFLNAMYVLVGIKEARISKVVGNKLFFCIRKSAV